MTSAVTPTLAKTPSAAAVRAHDAALRHPGARSAALRLASFDMARDIWGHARAPRATAGAIYARGQAIFRVLNPEEDYRRTVMSRWLNQVGGGLSHGGFTTLLAQTGAKTLAGGMLANAVITYLEDTVANMAIVHRGFIRDQARLSPADCARANAARLLVLGAVDALVMGVTLGVVAGLAAGLIGTTALWVTLAVLRTLRSCVIIYQSAYLDALKAQLHSPEARQLVETVSPYVINALELTLGRRIWQTTLIGCQTMSFLAPPPWRLAITAAQIVVGMGVSAVGKLQFLPLLDLPSAAEDRTR